MSKKDDARGKFSLGVSVHWLSTGFMDDIKAAGLDKDCNTYDLRRTIFRDKGANKICPRDGEKGVSYIDCLVGSDNVGVPNYTLSFSYQYSIGDVIESLENFCSSHDLDCKDVYVWMEAISNNFWRTVDKNETLSSKYIMHVASVGKMMFILDNWSDPRVLKRLWPLYEIYLARQHNGSVHILMPHRVKQEMINEILSGTGDGLNALYEALANTRLEESGISNDDERKIILNRIESNTGLVVANLRINDFLHEWARDIINDVKATVRSNNLLGVSVHWLRHGFLEEVKVAGFNRNSKIREIEDLRQVRPGMIRKKGIGKFCPIDKRIGAAYVHCLEEGNIGKATHMLSYTWSYTVGDIVDTLDGFCQRNNLDPKATFIWICCLCVNQHRVVEERKNSQKVPTTVFQAEFQSRVLAIPNLICMMTPWNKPSYLERVWCILEIYTAIEYNQNIIIAMPPNQREDMAKKVSAGNISLLYETLANVRVEDAKAGIKDDKDQILEIVKRGGGCAVTNILVKVKLHQWARDVIDNLGMGITAGNSSVPS